MITTIKFVELLTWLFENGYTDELDWSESVQPVSNPLDFWLEYSWVVLNSGMKNQIARKIWEKVRPAVMNGSSASSVFGHRGKAAGIDSVWKNKAQLFIEYSDTPDSSKVDWLKNTLPWIGPITKWHLAKNFGFDCAKPDRHLVRIAGDEGVNEMCKRLSRETGYRIATVDLVLWRSANLGRI